MLFPLPQPLDGAGRQTDGPSPLAGLRFADLQLSGLGDIHRPEDLQRPGLLVEVLPHEAADLAPAETGGQLRVEEVPPDLVAFHCSQKCLHLLLCEDLFGTMVGLGHHGPVGGVPGDHMGRLRVLQAPVEHGVDAEHHGVRQLMPVFRVFADPALVFQFSIQLLDVHAGHPGDDLVSQIGLDVAPDELLITPQGVGPQGGRTVVLHPPVQPFPQGHTAVFGELHILKGLQVPVELVQQFFLGLCQDIPEDGLAVLFVAHHDAALPAAVLPLSDHAVAGRPAFCHRLFLLVWVEQTAVVLIQGLQDHAYS